MKRRRFLELTALGAAGVSLPAARHLAGRSDPWHAYARPTLLALLGDRRDVQAIGTAYRQAVPEESTAGALVAAIDAERPAASEAGDGLTDRLDRQTRADFDHGRTVVVRGWVLSVTEARQCALHSLLYA